MVYKNYTWRAGARINADAQKVGLELEKLQKKNKGKIKPADIVKAAKKPNSVLHEIFDWDDTKAATEWRLSQARIMINSLRVDVVMVENPASEEKTSSVRAYVNVSSEDDRYYTETAAALQDVDLKAQVLSAAKRKISSAITDLKELENMSAAVDSLEKALEEIDFNLLPVQEVVQEEAPVYA